MKIFKPVIITISIIFILLVIVALITPPIAKNYIIKHSKELIGRQINIQGFYLNIFTGYTRLTGFQLLEQDDQQTFVAFDTLSVDISLFRMLANEIKINHILLVNPDIRLLQNGNEFNFNDLLMLGKTDSLSAISAPLDAIPTTEDTQVSGVASTDTISSSGHQPPSESMAIALYNISIRGGHIQYQDLVRNSIWQMENFDLQIPGVYFSGQNTDVGIALNFNDGGHLQTAIQYNMEAGTYMLDINLTNFSIAPIHPYLVDFLNTNSINGILNTHLNIEGNTDHITELTLRGNVRLHDLSLTDHQNQAILATDSILIDMDRINPGKSVFHFKTIAINGIHTTFDLRKDGSTFTDLMKTAPANTATIATSPNATAEYTTSEAIPDFSIDTFRMENSLFCFNDHTLHTPFTFNLENIDILANNLNLRQKNRLRINSTLKNGGNITFNYDGKLDDISNADIMLSIKNLDLTLFTPYSIQYFGYPLNKGILSFSSINNISANRLEGRNNLNIAKCEVANKQKEPKPEYNIPLKTALYLIKDVNEQIKMNLPVQGNIDSPEFSYKKIIFKTLTNLLVKVAVSPVSFLANSMGFSPDQLKNLPFEAFQNDFTPDQLTRINQLAELIKSKPEMTLVMEQFVNHRQSQTTLAQFYVKRNYYLQQHPDKNIASLQPIDFSKIAGINIKDLHFQNYVRNQVSEELQNAYLDEQILSIADREQLTELNNQLIDRRNQLLRNYLIRQGVNEKCIRISTASQEKLADYKGKNEYSINMVFEGDEPDNLSVSSES